MSVAAIENSGYTPTTQKAQLPQTDALSNAARQFEAILLMQLTSALNGSGDDSSGDEDALFGGDGGTSLAKKMFSEQLATTMAQAGGVGLADVIMRQIGGTATNHAQHFSNARAAVRDIRETGTGAPVAAAATAPTMANGMTGIISIGTESRDNYTAETPAASDENNYVSNEELNRIAFDINPSGVRRPKKVAAAVAASDAPVAMPRTGEKVNFRMPVTGGRISSGFGMRFHPVDKKMKLHAGVDIGVPKGTPIGAAAAGVVKFAGWRGGYGNAVIVEHADGTETLYGHNEKLTVKVGQTVAAGEVISLAGSTGKSTGPHLHFEVRRNGRPVDPRNFLPNVLR